MDGRHRIHSEEENQRASEKRQKWLLSSEGQLYIQKQSERSKLRVGDLHPNKGKKFGPRSDSIKNKIRLALTSIKRSEKTRSKVSLVLKGHPVSNQTKEKLRIAVQDLWQSPSYVQKQMISRKVTPNKVEILLQNILDEVDPGNWIYVGDGRDKQYIIGGKVPDFVHSSKKLIIELFGDYWHSEEVKGIPKEQHSQERIEHFFQHGYQTLIVWEYELQNQDTLKTMLRRSYLCV